MFEIFYEKWFLSILMFGCLFVGIFAKLFLGFLYQNMIRESDNMAVTENKALKQCKQKYANYCAGRRSMPNVSVFVERFMNRLSVGRLAFAGIYRMSEQSMMLFVLAAGVGVYTSIREGRTTGKIVPFYIVAFFGLYLYFSISSLVDIRRKQQVLKINLVDYLENYFLPRTEGSKKDIEMLYGEDTTQHLLA